MSDDMLDLDPRDIEAAEKSVRFMKQVLPRKLYEAQQSEYVKMNDAKLLVEANPDSLDWRLRLRYNSLLQKMLDPALPLEHKVIRAQDVYDDICSYDVFNRRASDKAKAVFITRRIGAYLEDQDAILTAMSQRLWEIASIPIIRDGVIDMEAAKLLHQTIKLLLDRKFGMAIQRQVTATLPGNVLPTDPRSFDPIRLEAELLQIESQIGVGTK